LKKNHGRPATRREFLSAATAMAATTILLPRAFAGQAESLASRLATDPERPQFHLLPAKNWMNDPNGPIYCNGRYHMFFQYNPEAATWGNMSWNHAVSPDMIHWTHLPVALSPTPGGYDSFGVFSGSAIAVGERVYAVYTGTQHSGADKATIRDGANNVQESQCLAWSDDPGLVHWTKDPANPVIPAPPAGLDITGFRDPSAWKQGDWYYLTVGSGVAKVGGCVLLYRSKDLRQWEYLHELTTGAWNGIPTANPCDDGQMWECPEFFPLDNGHVLIYSTLGKVYWQSGFFDETTLVFHPKKTGLLDFDAFYAPKTQLNAKGQRILWGWIPERRSEEAMRAAGWSGMMSLPRVLSLDPDGTLRMRILPALVSLRHGKIRAGESRAGTRLTLPRGTGEFLCAAPPNAQDFTVQLSIAPDRELLKIAYSAAKHAFTADGKEILLEAGDPPTVHGYVDGSVIEVILGERVGCTRRFYYPEPVAPDIEVWAVGGAVSAHAWKMKPISPNRLTTPARTA
jgi:beta-fructofuranosidase